ncbi:MAG: glycosyltransferase family 39 protein [Anaerolineae bacterium]|nr:glycosyltransferase family 39 protein [Anaerolineae bacterium]
MLRLLLTIIALAMAYTAQLLLDGKFLSQWVGRWERNLLLSVAGALYLVAMVIFGLAALSPAEVAARIRTPRRPPSRRDEPDARIIRPAWHHAGAGVGAGLRPAPTALTPAPAVIRPLLMLAAVGLGLAAVVIFCGRGENVTVRCLWLSSLAVLLISQFRWSGSRVVRQPRDPAAMRPADRTPKRPRDKQARVIELVTLALILAVAFGLRFYRLEAFPHDLDGDVASHGLEARKLLEGQQARLFGTMWAEIPTMGFVPAALSMGLFGNNLFGLYMASVIEGTLTVLGLYLLARELFRPSPPASRPTPLAPRPPQHATSITHHASRIATLAAALLTISYVHIHFSRITEYIDPWPFALFSLYFLVRGLQRHERLAFVASGLLMAIGFNMYYSARIVPVIILVFLGYAWLWRRDLLRGNGGGLALFGLAVLLGLGPMIPFFISHPYSFLSRSQDVFLFHPAVIKHLMGVYHTTSVGVVVREQIKRSLFMFHYFIDTSTQFGLARPMLDSFTSPLLVLGMGVALRHFRQAGHALAVIWLLLILLIGSALTNNAPFWPRLVGILPAAVLLVALAVERIWALVERLWGKTASALVAFVLVVGLIFVGLHNWQLYTRAVENNARPAARIGRYLYGLDPEINACMISEPWQLRMREIAFLAHPRATYDLPADAHGAALDACPGPRRVFILTANHLDVLPELQARYPGGLTQEHHEPYDPLVFVSYLLEQ